MCDSFHFLTKFVFKILHTFWSSVLKISLSLTLEKSRISFKDLRLDSVVRDKKREVILLYMMGIPQLTKTGSTGHEGGC